MIKYNQSGIKKKNLKMDTEIHPDSATRRASQSRQALTVRGQRKPSSPAEPLGSPSPKSLRSSVPVYGVLVPLERVIHRRAHAGGHGVGVHNSWISKEFNRNFLESYCHQLQEDYVSEIT